MNYNFSKSSQEAFDTACFFARSCGSGGLSSEHLLYGIARVKNSVGAVFLSNHGADAGEIEELVRQSRVFIPIDGDKDLKLSEKLLNVLESAQEASKNTTDKIIYTEQLLLAILEEEKSNAVRILRQIGVDTDLLSEELRCYKPSMKLLFADISQKKSKRFPYLEKYARNLTERAREKQTEKIIGREELILRMLEVLSRKSKNNPCLVGEAGVGKTAVVEALAQMTAGEEVPAALREKEIWLLDLALLTAGTKYRGDFEERIKGVVEEAKDPSVILFIDEIHTMVGAGSSEGALDCANILKPMLARGEIRVIGATTVGEYEKYIEKDPALERRFSKIFVREPDISETLRILSGLKSEYEGFHGVRIHDEALEEIVLLSEKYLTDRFFPDKAIDLLDETCASVGMNPQVQQRDVTKEDVLNTLKRKLGSNAAKDPDEDTMTAVLRTFLQCGDHALTDISAKICSVLTSKNKRSSLRAVMLFDGADSLKMRAAAKAVSSCLYGSEKNCLIIDLAEYRDGHSLSKLIGAQPGYIGYGEGGILTRHVKKTPFSVLLFEGIQFAGGEIRSFLEEICAEGEAYSGKGQKINFKNCVVIFSFGIEQKTRIIQGFVHNEEEAPRMADQAKGYKIFEKYADGRISFEKIE